MSYYKYETFKKEGSKEKGFKMISQGWIVTNDPKLLAKVKTRLYHIGTLTEAGIAKIEGMEGYKVVSVKVAVKAAEVKKNED